MVRRFVVALGLAFLSACAPAPKHGFAAYIVNQDAPAQATPGKSYSAEPCSLEARQGELELDCGGENALHLRVPLPDGKNLQAIVGATLSGVTGDVQLQQKLQLENGSLTLQTLDGDVARGNFNARVTRQSPPWEVVGSFVARVKP